jgi:Asp/Glu/hydantoin racemase
MRAAAAYGPFVVLTGGAAWVPMLHRLAQALPLPAPLLGVHALPRSGGEMAAQPEAAVQWLAEAGEQALQRWPQARALLLGGAGLAGLAAPLAGRLPVPVLDNVDLALHHALRAALGGAHELGAPGAAPAAQEAGPWCGLGPGLAHWLPGTPRG